MKICDYAIFKYQLPCMELHNIREYKEPKPWLVACYNHEDRNILVNMDYFKDFNERQMYEVIIHEMAHAYCRRMDIEDIIMHGDVQFHNEAYKKVLAQHGCGCKFDSIRGYNDVILTKKALWAIKCEKAYLFNGG